MAKIIVMIGAPGVGKGTQARLLSEKYGIPQISTGDILREMALAETSLGQSIKQTLADGQLVEDSILAEVVKSATSTDAIANSGNGNSSNGRGENGYILDGYPRTPNQARQLEDLATAQGHKVLLVRIYVSDDAFFKRLTGRRTCTKCGEIYNIYSRPPKVDGICDKDGAPLVQRSDDTPETVTKRLDAYNTSTAPLIEYYRQSNRLIEIDGDRNVNKVFENLISLINEE